MKYIEQNLSCKLIILFASLLLSGSPTAVAMTDTPQLEISDMYYYRIYDGMGSEKVYSILEGSDRAIWMGTRTGVERFNGRKIKHYNLSDHQQSSNFAGRVIKLFGFRPALDGDSSNPQGVKAGVGAFDNTGRIYLFNNENDKFEILLRLSDRLNTNVQLNDVVQIKDGSLLLGLNSGLYQLKDNRLFRLVPNTEVNSIKKAGEKAVLATTDGIAMLELGNKPRLVRGLRGVNVQSVYSDSKSGDVYAGTFDAGLWRYNFTNRLGERLETGQKALQNPIRAFADLGNNRIAVGIDGSGIYLYDTQERSIRKLVDTDDSQRFYLNGNGVYSLMRDSYGNLWSGSYTGGAAVLLFRPSAVTAIRHEAGNPQSVRHNNINAIAENSDGSIWYATDRGISIYNPTNGGWRHSNNSSVIVTLASMPGGRMVAGTYGNGLLELDANGNVVRSMMRNSGTVTSNSIFCIKRSQSGDYWAATLDGGVMQLDRTLRLLRTYPIEVAFSIAETPNGEIGVATANGFYIINPTKHDYRHYAAANQVSNSDITCYITSLLFNNDGTVWCGTEGGGLFLYDLAHRNVLKVFKTEQGLPANDIYSMQRDSQGRMIVSTSHGLAIYNQQGFKSLNYLHRLAKEYNKSASALLANGDMIFGSVDGAERLIPSKITNANYEAKVNIRGAETVADRSSDIATSLNGDETVSFHPVADGKIKLDYADRSFSVCFEAINLPYQDDITYQYVLEGYEDSWSQPTHQGVADYKNVDPGSYTLRVRSLRNSDGQILDEESVKVVVASPWWGSWWAKCVYFAVCIAILVILYRAYKFKIQKQYDDDKIKFFVNTAHNIRTPVSLVMAPITDLKHDESLSEKGRELVETALTNIAKLSNITNQLLEFERFDSGHTRIELHPVEISSLLKIETECFRDAFERKNIRLKTKGFENEAYITADTYLLEMLFDNLLSNAYKYTNSGGEVDVELRVDQRRLQIVVQDNGIGIPGEERRRVMKEVYRARNARLTSNTGTGFGLLQVRRIVTMLGGKIRLHSEEGEGTMFVMTFARIFPTIQDGCRSRLERKSINTFVDSDIYSCNETYLETETSQTGADHSILIVEDNDELRRYLRDMFGEKYNVTAVSNADSALSYLQNHYPDLILSDVMMPGMQGDELCRRVKNDPATAGIPVILLTAKADQSSVIEGLGCGADDYIAKPFNSDILRLKVGGMIANRDRMRQQLLSQAIAVEVPEGGDGDIREEVVIVSAIESAEGVEVDENQATAGDNAAPIGDGLATDSDRKFVERATGIVLLNMGDPDFDIDRLCREMAMSRTLFFGRLKSLTGKAPQDFIRLLRMERAAELLRQGVSVTDVAERVGIANVKYFSTVFKKHFGIQPSKFE